MGKRRSKAVRSANNSKQLAEMTREGGKVRGGSSERIRGDSSEEIREGSLGRAREKNEGGSSGEVRERNGEGFSGKVGFFGKFRGWFRRFKEKRRERVNPHRSFRRSYREDYVVETEVPSITYHMFATFKIIFKNWKLFVPLLAILVVLSAVFIGIMKQSDYVRFQDILDETTVQVAGGEMGNVARAGMLLISTVMTGGLSGESSEAAIVFTVLIFIIMWLTTIYLLRHILAKNKVKLRDGLYNAMTPFLSTFLVVLVAFIQCIPIFAFVVVLSAAIQTEFLTTPFYALVFFIFAAVMFTMSFYFLSSSLIALVAVSAPGLYPMQALHTASDLMMGRRIKFIIRLIALVLMLVVLWVLVMLPLILFDLGMKNFEWTTNIPFIPVCLSAMTWFTGIYVTAYIYLYYRWMLK